MWFLTIKIKARRRFSDETRCKYVDFVSLKTNFTENDGMDPSKLSNLDRASVRRRHVSLVVDESVL